MGVRIVAVLAALLSGVPLLAQQQAPEVFLMSPPTLLAARESYGKPGGDFAPAIDALLRDARAALMSAPVSVMQKTETPPSGDKHDYMSVAPYWWPDPARAAGVPYVRRDGERNPEHDTIGDRVRLGTMIGNIQTLALAYFISQQESFAQSAAAQLRVWFLDEETRMNPNLNFAQAIKGISNGRGIGIIDTYGFRDLIDAIQLLRGSKHWPAAADQRLKEWFSAYLKWLRESPNGKEEAAQKNNHGTAYDVQVGAIALYLGKKDITREIAAGAQNKRIMVQIMPDGSQPLELARTKSWGYSLMNTEALINLALLGDHAGVDLWHHTSADGRSIRKAIDFLLPYALAEKTWSAKQIVPIDRERLIPILRIAALKYDDARYRLAGDRLSNANTGKARMNLVLPRDVAKQDAQDEVTT